MKKMFKSTALLLALMAAFAFVGCSNSSSSGDSDWQNVVNMSDLVGTWVCSASVQGMNEVVTYTVSSDFSTSVKDVVDYSAADPMTQLIIQTTIVPVLEKAGYTCNDDTVAKKLTATRSFTSSEFRSFVFGGGVKINSAKDKAKMKDAQGKEAIFTKIVL